MADQEMLREAEVIATVLEGYRGNECNIFGGGRRQKLAGEMGRLALRRYLRMRCCPYEEDLSLGKPDRFDFIIDGRNVSLKTSLVGSDGDPQPYWYCEVNAKQLDHPCDYYLFAKAYPDPWRAWLVGCITKEAFDRIGVLRQKGEMATLPRGGKSWPVRDTKKDVRISDLDDLETIIQGDPANFYSCAMKPAPHAANLKAPSYWPSA